MQQLIKTTCLVIIVMLFSSCATKILWEETDPSDYVLIPAGSITEDELKQKGLKYYKEDKQNAYYIEKTELYKFRDYSVRLFGTPVSVVVDAATVIVVIGAAALAGDWWDKCSKEPQCRDNYYQQKDAPYTK